MSLSRNLFDLSFNDDDGSNEQEFVEVIEQTKFVRIERIVSTGQCSPPGFWYDQDEVEWVSVISGEGHLRILGTTELIRLKPGDWITIPAHQKHRVEWTDPTQPTIWIAVFMRESATSPAQLVS